MRPRTVPGTVLVTGKAGLEVGCGAATSYLIEELQPEGKSVMSAHAFSLGTKITPGDSSGVEGAGLAGYSSRRKFRGSTRLPSLKTS